MTTRWAAKKRSEEESANVRYTSQDNQAPSQEQAPQGYQAPVNLPVMMDREIRSAFINLAQATTTQDQPVATQVQAILPLKLY